MTTATRARRSSGAEPKRRRFTVDEWDRMIAAGIFAGERIELIDGEIVCMAPMESPHIGTLNRANQFLVQILAGSAIVQIQCPVRLGRYQEPEPDVAVLRPRADFYASAKPAAADVLLLIEVSDTTLATDSGRKLAVYASAGVADYWIADLNGERILVFRAPQGRRYADLREYRRGESIIPLAFPDLAIRVEDLLGPGEPEAQAGQTPAV